MRKERKVLIEKLNELSMQRDAEYEMGCGFSSKEIHETFAPYYYEIKTELAKTYNLSLGEYMDREYERMMSDCFRDPDIPFN